LKTSLRYQLEKMSPEEIRRRQADLAAGYQASVLDALVRKARLALEAGAYRSFGLSGGVANNGRLQAALAEVAQRQGVAFLRALPQHTGDNAGMIAFAAWAECEPGGLDESGFGLEIAPSAPLGPALRG